MTCNGAVIDRTNGELVCPRWPERVPDCVTCHEMQLVDAERDV